MSTLLVVDDAESVRFYHQLLFTRAGYDVVAVATANQAMSMLGSRSVDLIVIDPHTTKHGNAGDARCEQLARGSNLPPMLVVSSEPPPADLERGRRCEFVRKPCLPEELLTSIGRLLA